MLGDFSIPHPNTNVKLSTFRGSMPTLSENFMPSSHQRDGTPEIVPEPNDNNCAGTAYLAESENTETISNENVYEGNDPEYSTLFKGVEVGSKGKKMPRAGYKGKEVGHKQEVEMLLKVGERIYKIHIYRWVPLKPYSS